jgi:PIN domain nuclease of toxin-antitoxin system
VIVLDTHVWLWWSAGSHENLSPAARVAIAKADVIAVSAVSCCEIAWLCEKRKLVLDRDPLRWLQQALLGVELLSLTPEIAVAAARLLWPYGDPGDRIVMATSVIHRAPLITKDARIRRFQGVQTIW